MLVGAHLRLSLAAKPLICALLLTCSVGAFGATVAKVKVPGEKAYLAWLSYTSADGRKQATQPVRFRGPKTTVEDGTDLEKAKDTRLHVLDPDSGNEAVVRIDFKPDKPTEVALSEASFKTVRQVRVRIVNSKGRLLESALVTLTDSAGRKQTQVVDPTSRGAAVFQDVASGKANAAVVYGDGRSAIQDIDITLERKQPVLEAEVPVAGEVATLKESKSPAGTRDRAAAKQPSTGGLESALAALIGLIILAGILTAIYALLRSKGITAKSALERLGADLSTGETQQPQTAAPPPIVPEGTCPFCGQKKDPVTGACACSIATSQTAAATGPRLVGVQGPYLGRAFNIPGTGATIGRGADNTIPLVDDNTASRHHAVIAIEGGAYLIRDQGSSNGTFVNGARITEHALKAGDEVKIGSTRFRFEV